LNTYTWLRTHVHPSQIGSLVAEGHSIGSTPAPSVSITLKVEDLDKKSAALAEETKKLSHIKVCMHVYIHVFLKVRPGYINIALASPNFYPAFAHAQQG
jgi:hypothetical protein